MFIMHFFGFLAFTYAWSVLFFIAASFVPEGDIPPGFSFAVLIVSAILGAVTYGLTFAL